LPARLTGLDTLRAIAVVLVLMSHYDGVVSHASTFGIIGDAAGRVSTCSSCSAVV
jgi:peptidoglycan/LPS O-acetylase OafA/YrhL